MQGPKHDETTIFGGINGGINWGIKQEKINRNRFKMYVLQINCVFVFLYNPEFRHILGKGRCDWGIKAYFCHQKNQKNE